MITVIHISADYPDIFEPAKTAAIANLIEATHGQFDHRVYSLNRVDIAPVAALGRWMLHDWPGGFRHCGSCANVSSWEYQAPPHGVFMRSVLEALADTIADDIIHQGITPHLILGHKLSIEGIIARRIAARFAVPYGLSLQGNSDRRILSVRRDLHPHYRDIYRNAAVIFPFAPWIKTYCNEVLGLSSGTSVLLPCMTRNDATLTPSVSSGKLAISAFHLRHWHLKNADRIIAAAGLVGRKRQDFRLDIAGGGVAEEQALLEHLIAEDAPGHARLVGEVSGEAIQSWMNKAAVFVMPSRRETFGLVFIEALMAGCPVIYPENAAIDGYFEGYSFARAVPVNNVGAIAAAIEAMMENEMALKQELAEWQDSSHAKQFCRDNTARAFADGLRLAGRQQHHCHSG